jgi:hypothetical protein
MVAYASIAKKGDIGGTNALSLRTISANVESGAAAAAVGDAIGGRNDNVPQ